METKLEIVDILLSAPSATFLKSCINSAEMKIEKREETWASAACEGRLGLVSALFITAFKEQSTRFADPDLERGDRQPWTYIAITMRNHSTREVYLVSSVTQRDYDLGTRTLVVGLVVPRTESESDQLHRTVPPTVQVEPGESVVVHVAAPLVIRRFVGGGGLGGNAI